MAKIKINGKENGEEKQKRMKEDEELSFFLYPGQWTYFLFSYQSVSDVGPSRLLQEISH